MSSKTAVTIGLIVGSTIGGYIPTLWGEGFFSYSSILTSAVGSVIGIYTAYKITN